MDEYIKRSYLMGEITSSEAQAEIKQMDGCGAYNRMLEIVNSAPAADAVHVVQCKDCIHRIIKNMGWNIGEVGGCEIFNVALPCDFFCAYGKRKEGTDHD